MANYNSLYSVSSSSLPPQSISLKEKLAKPKNDSDKCWGHACMDALEVIGKEQFQNNLKLIENYEMVKGRFIFNHYFHTEGYQSMLNQLTTEFELPSYLRHYDIISQVTNTLSGEWQKRPDVFRVRQIGDGASNEYLRKKIELTKGYVFGQIDAEINKALAAQGIDPDKDDFKSEEEAQQFSEQLQQAKNQMTPPEIQRYMNIDFLTMAEIWGQHQREFDREYFNLPEKEKVEFEDMLVADRCFRHFYITATGYNQETWNPVNVFFHKSPDVTYIEDGDYSGRIFNISLNTIIDRYGHLMTREDLELLNGTYKNNNKKWNDSQFNWVYDNYLVPFKGYETYDLMRKSWNVSPNGDVPELDPSLFENLHNGELFHSREGYYFVTEGYWKTQKKLYKITYFDEELQTPVIKIVDENYIIPDHFVESNRIFDNEHPINTYCETSITEVWKGIKINTGTNHDIRKDLYLGIGPNDFQFKGDLNIYGSKLPVCGQVFSIRNSKSMSIVDMMKPYQIAHNVCMNQIYQLMEKEIGMFVVMDVNMFPNSKDWGGEDAWDKWMMVAKNYGLLPADTSPQNIKGSLASTGGFLPKVLDLNLASQMMSRVNLAQFYEQQALKQVGFNQYRTGNFAASSTATGIEQGAEKSYSQTESLFTNFSNYLRRCLQMGLDIAQFVQSQKEQVTINYIKSDFSRAFTKILGIDLLLPQLGVFISNSQEQIRQLEMIRQFALNNNTSGLSPVDVANVVMMNSPHEIRNQLEVSYNKMLQQQQQQSEAQQQAVQQDLQLKQHAIEVKHQEFEDMLDNNLDVARVKAGASILSQDVTIPEPPMANGADAQKAQQSSSDNNIKQQKVDLDRQKLQASIASNQQKMAMTQAKINADLQIQNKQTETARILKGKEMP